MKKVIITDVDGVILKWQSMLPFFAQEKGIDLTEILKCQISEEFIHTKDLFRCSALYAKDLKEEYHNSKLIRHLTAYNDALDVLNNLPKDEYKVIAVSALDCTKTAMENRSYNLNVLFPGVFSEIHLTENDKSETFLHLIHREEHVLKNKIVAYVDDLSLHIDSFRFCYYNFHKKEFDYSFFLHRGKRDQHPLNRKSLITENGYYDIKDWYQLKERLL